MLFDISFEGNEKFEDFFKSEFGVRIPKKLIETNFAYDLQNICITDAFLTFNYIKNRIKMNAIFNLETKEIVFNSPAIFATHSILTEKGIPVFKFPQFCYKNEFISVIETQNIVNNKKVFQEIKNINENSMPSINKFINTKTDDNPVLAFYTIN
jgi:hypothetical protein